MPEKIELLTSDSSGNKVTRENIFVIEDKIEILERIGEGTYGRVSRGKWHGSDVAVKELHQWSEEIKEIKDDFLREIELMRKNGHPCIVKLYGIILRGESCSIVMQFSREGSLYRLLHETKEDLLWSPTRLRIALSISSGLEYLHASRILHRDLKPHNVLVFKEGEEISVQIADFGASRIVLPNYKGRLTRGIGTNEYMAPEVLEAKDYDEKIDIYSLAIILWELATREAKILCEWFYT